MNTCQHLNSSKDETNMYYCEDCNTFLSAKEYKRIGLTQCTQCENMLGVGEVCWGTKHYTRVK